MIHQVLIKRILIQVSEMILILKINLKLSQEIKFRKGLIKYKKYDKIYQNLLILIIKKRKKIQKHKFLNDYLNRTLINKNKLTYK
jgi:hypothetical protein